MKRHDLNSLIKNTDFPTYISNNGKNKSIIDYVLEKDDNKSKIKECILDHEDIYRVECTKNNKIYRTDHRTIIFDLPIEAKVSKKRKVTINKQVVNPDFSHINSTIKKNYS